MALRVQGFTSASGALSAGVARSSRVALRTCLAPSLGTWRRTPGHSFRQASGGRSGVWGDGNGLPTPYARSAGYRILLYAKALPSTPGEGTGSRRYSFTS